MSKKISRIEEVYRYLELTQMQFADELGMSVRRIQDYMKGADVSSKFIKSLEKKYPSINPDFIRNKSDSMLIRDIRDDQKDNFIRNLKLAEKDNEIELLKEKLYLKELEIKLLKEKIKSLEK